MIQFSKLDFWQMFVLSFLPNWWYHFYIWVDCGGYMSSGDVSWWVSINNFGVTTEIKFVWLLVCFGRVTLMASIEGRKSQVQINACICCHCARMTSSVLTNIFLVSSSGILKPDLWTKELIYSKHQNASVIVTCTTLLLSPEISAILSKSCPSGLQSSWKFAWRMWICSSVNVVRFLLDFLFLFLFVSWLVSQVSPSVEEP